MDRSTDHATFVIERTYPAAADTVFAAWADPANKRHWFAGDEAIPESFELDFRSGGQELVRGGPEGGPVFAYTATYQEIVPNERIVYTYSMTKDDTCISASVSTVELRPKGPETLLTYTEQIVFLDGEDTLDTRESGTNELLSNLEAFLARS